MRTLSVVLMLLCASVVLTTGDAAATQPQSVEVRVAARSTDRGVEFGIQQQLSDGSWSAYKLGARRFFTDNLHDGRWKHASPVLLDTSSVFRANDAEAGARAQRLDVRVAARSTERGIEFAVQQRLPDGSWSDYRLGARRFFTPNLHDGHWKHATPVRVEAPPPPALSIITEGPTIVSVPSLDTDGDGKPETYGPSDVIEIRIGVSQQSCGYGGLLLSFQTGDGPAVLRQAEYGECTPRSVSFDYLVVPGDLDADGISIEPNSISLTTYEGEVRNTDHSAVPANPEHRVNGDLADRTPPRLVAAPGISNRPLDGETFREGESILIRAEFTEQVIVDPGGGPPTLVLEVGEQGRRAEYVGPGDTPAVLIFEYIVQAGDWDNDGEIRVRAGSMLIPSGSSIADRAGNLADTFWSVSSGREYGIETEAAESPAAVANIVIDGDTA